LHGPSLATGAVLGVGAGWLLDRRSGRRRRRALVDRSAALLRRSTRRSRRFVRHGISEVNGLVQRVAHRFVRRRPELDDATLSDKVRSILFRDDAVPKGQISVNAERGWIYLRGELDSPELIQRLGESAQRIEGVRGVKNLLHTPGTAAA